MFWCHNCRLRLYELHGNASCPRCHSLAIQECSAPQSPNQFEPFQIRSSLLSRLPQPPPPRLDLSQFEGPVSIRVETTLLQAVSHPGHIRVIREYFVIPFIEKQAKHPVSKEKLESLERTLNLSQCAICQDGHYDEGIVLPCKHAFHEKCVSPWFSLADTCPCCRATV